MGKATVYCELCGTMILEEAFLAGRALRFQDKNYCESCKRRPDKVGTSAAAGQPSSLSRRGPDEVGTKADRQDPSSSSLPAAPAAQAGKPGSTSFLPRPERFEGPASSPSSSSLLRKTGSASESALRRGEFSAVRPGPSNGARKKTGLYWLYGIAACAAAAGIGLWIHSTVEENRKREEARQRVEEAKRTAISLLESESQTDPAMLLQEIDLWREKLRGTQWEEGITQLRRRTEKRLEEARLLKDWRDRLQKLKQGLERGDELSVLASALRSLKQEAAAAPASFHATLEETLFLAQERLLRRSLQEIEKYHATYPDHFDETLDRYASLRLKAEQLGARTAALARTIDQAISAVREKKEARAQEDFHQKLRPKAEDLVGRKLFELAVEECQQFLKTHPSTKILAEVTELRQQIEKEKAAYLASRPAQEPSGPQKDAAAAATDSATGMIDLFNGKDIDGWRFLSKTRGTTEIRDGVLRITNPKPLPAGADPFSAEHLSFLCVGETHWKDLILEFEYSIENGGMQINLRFGPENALAAPGVKIEPRVLEPGRWYKAKLEIAGQELIFSGDSMNTLRAPIPEGASPEGFIGMAVPAGGALLLRSVRVKVTR